MVGIRVLVVAPNLSAWFDELPRSSGDALAWLQHQVRGCVEVFHPADGAGVPGWHAYCNENGWAYHLTPNAWATRLARAAGWPGDTTLLGRVVFVGCAGNRDKDLPTAMLHLAYDLFGPPL